MAHNTGYFEEPADGSGIDCDLDLPSRLTEPLVGRDQNAEPGRVHEVRGAKVYDQAAGLVERVDHGLELVDSRQVDLPQYRKDDCLGVLVGRGTEIERHPGEHYYDVAMRGFELISPSSPTWIDLARDLIATAATPLDLSVDRLSDLMVLSTRVVAEALESPGSDQIEVSVEVDDHRILVGVSSTGLVGTGGMPVSKAALSVLADEHGSTESTAGTRVWFALNG